MTLAAQTFRGLVAGGLVCFNEGLSERYSHKVTTRCTLPRDIISFHMFDTMVIADDIIMHRLRHVYNSVFMIGYQCSGTRKWVFVSIEWHCQNNCKYVFIGKYTRYLYLLQSIKFTTLGHWLYTGTL